MVHYATTYFSSMHKRSYVHKDTLLFWGHLLDA